MPSCLSTATTFPKYLNSSYSWCAFKWKGRLRTRIPYFIFRSSSRGSNSVGHWICGKFERHVKPGCIPIPWRINKLTLAPASQELAGILNSHIPAATICYITFRFIEYPDDSSSAASPPVNSLLWISFEFTTTSTSAMCYRTRPTRRFESRVKQIVLVRNLPFHLNAYQLCEMFKDCGNIIAVDKQLGMTHGKCLWQWVLCGPPPTQAPRNWVWPMGMTQSNVLMPDTAVHRQPHKM